MRSVFIESRTFIQKGEKADFLRGPEKPETGAMRFDMLEIGFSLQKTDPPEKPMDAGSGKRLASVGQNHDLGFHPFNLPTGTDGLRHDPGRDLPDAGLLSWFQPQFPGVVQIEHGSRQLPEPGRHEKIRPHDRKDFPGRQGPHRVRDPSMRPRRYF